MQIDILTIFPGVFEQIFNESMLKRAREKNLITIKVYNLRDWTTDKHKTTDDKPFGGGPGMIMKPEPIFKAVETLNKNYKLQITKYKQSNGNSKVQKFKTTTILLTPKGDTFTQQKAQELSKLDHLILICGHYEGVDQRVHDYLADEKISIGNYVLTGGEIPAMVVTDAITRLIPGVLGNLESLKSESFSGQIINKATNQQNNSLNPKSSDSSPRYDHPNYTHPRAFTYHGKKLSVPEILLSGDHKKIAIWRNNFKLS